MLRKTIEEILNEFPFDRVEKIMLEKGWKLFNGEKMIFPSVEYLKKFLKERYETSKETGYCRAGRFEVRRLPKGINVRFQNGMVE